MTLTCFLFFGLDFLMAVVGISSTIHMGIFFLVFHGGEGYPPGYAGSSKA